MYNLQAEHFAIPQKPIAASELLLIGFLVCMSLIIDVEYMFSCTTTFYLQHCVLKEG
jgi:hypothetical protein